MSDQTILVVEDEPAYVEALEIGLHREGYRTVVARDGVEALEQYERHRPDLVLLDVMLPKISGIDVCRRLRLTSTVPIIMVTAKSSEIDTVVGLEVGADDYVVKPYRIRELVARIRALLRRTTAAGDITSGAVADASISVGDVRLDPDEYRVVVRGTEVVLARKEFEMLHLFLINAGRALTRDTILERVWGHDHVGDGKTLDVHIRRLRSKVEPDPRRPERIVTIRGVGYKFVR